MRSLAGLAIVLGCAATPGLASAEPPAVGAAFAPSSALGDPALARLLDRNAFGPDGRPLRWRSSSAPLNTGKGGQIDSLRLSVGDRSQDLAAAPLRIRPDEVDAYEIAVTRDWPAAVQVDAGDYALALTPHAGLGMTHAGGSAEAGAVLTLGQKRSRDEEVARRLKDLGVRDGAEFGQEGRWYLFAAASGRAVGLNVTRRDGGWDRAGWSTDPAAVVGDAHVGVGWRKGDVQTSFGYIHREVKGEHRISGAETKDDSLVAFSLTIKPRR
jgi:hypothetical protein